MSDQMNTEKQLLNNWYQYASRLAGSVDSLLAVLRYRERVSKEEQRILLGLDKHGFARLQAMRAPRTEFFIEDSRRIAQACELKNQDEFVSWMILGRNLQEKADSSPSVNNYYEAAFDARDDLDEIPEE